MQICGKRFSLAAAAQQAPESDHSTLKRYLASDPYKCEDCGKALHPALLAGVAQQEGAPPGASPTRTRERLEKLHGCGEDCGHTTKSAEEHYHHVKLHHQHTAGDSAKAAAVLPRRRSLRRNSHVEAAASSPAPAAAGYPPNVPASCP
uniref:C2H2-type domain-containing protein n=1 Tax=Macrostomum lignano TaxID=282301 RepID=A0A1I8F8Z4_9PLAT